ncbi:MAG: UDP-N-acetylmuramoyl-L-alanyl-D-glutamate--2,6-diaminopimelate ligase [Pyrinomonadaceae bacterium]
MKNKSGVSLGAVAKAVGGKLTGDAEARVVDVTHDSRQVRAGWLFAAIRGSHLDAHRFLRQVGEQDAAGVISERERPDDFEGAWIQVDDARRALAYAAAEVQGHPSEELALVGITGTNGKTTTAYLVNAIAESEGGGTALLTTVEYRVAGERIVAERTTPEACDVQRYFRRAVDAGARVAVMEASSQALDLHRCDALRFAVAVYTNLTRDHLDYHGTMENYFAAKLKLFDGSLGARPATSVVNIDDETGARLASELESSGGRVVRYALDAEADVTAHDLAFTPGGMRFVLRTPQGERTVETPLTGRPHIYNLLAASATCLALGFDADAIVRAVKTCAGASGRFERVPHRGDFAVVVDYAHTDDALDGVLRTAREVTKGRIITVFGCGGDRDRSKRAPMGEVAARLSDVVIVTSDNPRTEDPEAIIADVEKGMRETGKPYLKIADRREAIRTALREARGGDMVLIAGKGHETYQIIGTVTHHFDDREVALEALAKAGGEQ